MGDISSLKPFPSCHTKCDQKQYHPPPNKNAPHFTTQLKYKWGMRVFSILSLQAVGWVKFSYSRVKLLACMSLPFYQINLYMGPDLFALVKVSSPQPASCWLSENFSPIQGWSFRPACHRLKLQSFVCSQLSSNQLQCRASVPTGNNDTHQWIFPDLAANGYSLKCGYSVDILRIFWGYSQRKQWHAPRDIIWPAWLAHHFTP